MGTSTIPVAQVIHRTCAGCGDVTHYDGTDLRSEQLAALPSLICEKCGASEAVIMMTEAEPATRFAFVPLPAERQRRPSNRPE